MEYNLSQLAAINSKEDKVIIKAPAGSGKTSSIVGAVYKYREEHPNDKIVAITFTRKAAAELKNRINLLNVEISTIHSWSLRRLNALAAEYNFVVSLLEDDVIKDILLRLCKLRRQYYLNQFQLFSFIMGNYNIDIDDKIRRIFESIYLDYKKFKQKNQLYDFTDLPQYLADKLNEYDERIVDIDALFVDEFQDIDPVELSVFDVVDAKKKVFIGDPLQSIYQFRGSLEEVFDSLEDFTEYTLDVNYRSYQEIIDYARTVNDVARELNARHNLVDFLDINWSAPSDIICERGNGGKIYLSKDVGHCVEITKDEPCSEVLIVSKLLADPHTQILCRGNKQVKKIQAQGVENVSTVHQAKGLEYDNVILTNFPIDGDEERNVAYVGMTRAKNVLCLIDFDVLLYVICSEGISTSKKLF